MHEAAFVRSILVIISELCTILWFMYSYIFTLVLSFPEASETSTDPKELMHDWTFKLY